METKFVDEQAVREAIIRVTGLREDEFSDETMLSEEQVEQILVRVLNDCDFNLHGENPTVGALLAQARP